MGNKTACGAIRSNLHWISPQRIRVRIMTAFKRQLYRINEQLFLFAEKESFLLVDLSMRVLKLSFMKLNSVLVNWELKVALKCSVHACTRVLHCGRLQHFNSYSCYFQ